jgi:hypothetical protein
VVDPYEVVEVKGPTVFLKRGNETKARNKCHVKKFKERLKDNTKRHNENQRVRPDQPQNLRPQRVRTVPRYLTDYNV